MARPSSIKCDSKQIAFTDSPGESIWDVWRRHFNDTRAGRPSQPPLTSDQTSTISIMLFGLPSEVVLQILGELANSVPDLVYAMERNEHLFDSLTRPDMEAFWLAALLKFKALPQRLVESRPSNLPVVAVALMLFGTTCVRCGCLCAERFPTREDVVKPVDHDWNYSRSKYRFTRVAALGFAKVCFECRTNSDFFRVTTHPERISTTKLGRYLCTLKPIYDDYIEALNDHTGDDTLKPWLRQRKAVVLSRKRFAGIMDTYHSSILRVVSQRLSSACERRMQMIAGWLREDGQNYATVAILKTIIYYPSSEFLHNVTPLTREEYLAESPAIVRWLKHWKHHQSISTCLRAAVAHLQRNAFHLFDDVTLLRHDHIFETHFAAITNGPNCYDAAHYVLPVQKYTQTLMAGIVSKVHQFPAFAAELRLPPLDGIPLDQLSLPQHAHLLREHMRVFLLAAVLFRQTSGRVADAPRGNGQFHMMRILGHWQTDGIIFDSVASSRIAQLLLRMGRSPLTTTQNEIVGLGHRYGCLSCIPRTGKFFDWWGIVEHARSHSSEDSPVLCKVRDDINAHLDHRHGRALETSCGSDATCATSQVTVPLSTAPPPLPRLTLRTSTPRRTRHFQL
ncbi:hypothetical protein BKA62DRAFT_332969 [Auriculariales sp. MPI-PUGE-AT-0066]|nr:hypothetical protein BKA62DRAFT_332969 [Auriculariales sp. MPI-PUGE-AT-0066]